MGRGYRGCLFGAILVFGAPSVAFAGAQTFNTALPVAEGQTVFRQLGLYRQASDDPSPADRELATWAAVSVLGHGITGDLTLFGVVPYADKALERPTPDGRHIERGSSGLGDVRLFARYTALARNLQGATWRVAPFVGMETPTGEDAERDRFGRLPRPLQSGSGSWDPFGGVVVTWQTLQYEIDGQASYQANTTAEGFEFGDMTRLDGSFQYRLWPRALGSGIPGFLYGVVETNLIHRQENRIGGVKDPDSGGTRLFLDPGLQYVTQRWVAEAIAQIPVMQDPNGAALKEDWRIQFGFRVWL